MKKGETWGEHAPGIAAPYPPACSGCGYNTPRPPHTESRNAALAAPAAASVPAGNVGTGAMGAWDVRQWSLSSCCIGLDGDLGGEMSCRCSLPTKASMLNPIFGLDGTGTTGKGAKGIMLREQVQ